MPTDATGQLIKNLRAWTKDHDPHVRAAVELLIWHEYWLRRRDFTDTYHCVVRDRSDAWINWRSAREFVDSKPKAFVAELAILDLAVALGENRYHLSTMGSAHSQAIVAAVRSAVGL